MFLQRARRVKGSSKNLRRRGGFFIPVFCLQGRLPPQLAVGVNRIVSRPSDRLTKTQTEAAQSLYSGFFFCLCDLMPGFD